MPLAGAPDRGPRPHVYHRSGPAEKRPKLALLPWRRTVIYNYLTGRPITFFDFDGGLRRKDAITAATPL